MIKKLLNSSRNLVILFSVLAIIFFLYSDKIVLFVSGLNPLLILVISTLLSPIYLIFIIYMYNEGGWKYGIFAFIFSALADTISLPHLLNLVGENNLSSFPLFTDTLIYSFIPSFLKTSMLTLPIVGQVKLAILLLYVVIPILIILLSLMYLKKKTFKEIFKNSI